jgi:hypothetical protein
MQERYQTTSVRCVDLSAPTDMRFNRLESQVVNCRCKSQDRSVLQLRADLSLSIVGHQALAMDVHAESEWASNAIVPSSNRSGCSGPEIANWRSSPALKISRFHQAEAQH